MKKLLAGIAVVLVTAAGATSYIGHSLARQAFDSQLAELHRAAPLYGMTIKEAALEQGLFKGYARLHLAFDSEERGQPLLMNVASELGYGPLLATAQGLRPGLLAVASRVSLTGLPAPSQQRLDTLFGPHPLTLDAYVNLSRQVVAEVKVPAVRAVDQGERIAFAGIVVELVHDAGTGSYLGEVAFGELRIESPQARLHSAPAQGRFAFDLHESGLMPGELRVNFPEVVLQRGIDMITVRGVGLRADSRLEEDGLWASETFSVGEVIPPHPIRNAAITFELERVNPQALVLWSEMAATLQGAAPGPAQLRRLADLLLRQGTGLNVRYAMAAPAGQLRADLELAYQGLADGRDPLDAADPQLLIAALEAELRVEADEALLNSLPVAAMLPQFVAQGLVVLEQRRYRSEARLEQGRLSINGVPVPLNGLTMRPAGWVQ